MSGVIRAGLFGSQFTVTQDKLTEVFLNKLSVLLFA